MGKSGDAPRKIAKEVMQVKYEDAILLHFYPKSSDRNIIKESKLLLPGRTTTNAHKQSNSIALHAFKNAQQSSIDGRNLDVFEKMVGDADGRKMT